MIFWDKISYSLAALRLPMYPRMALKFWSSWFYLPSASIVLPWMYSFPLEENSLGFQYFIIFSMFLSCWMRFPFMLLCLCAWLNSNLSYFWSFTLLSILPSKNYTFNHFLNIKEMEDIGLAQNFENSVTFFLFC